MSANSLKQIPMFKPLNDNQLNGVEHLRSQRSFAKGQEIIREGSLGTDFFIVEKGSVAINKNVAGGRKRNLANLGEGEIFGELAIFDREPRSANVEAIEDTQVSVFQVQAFRDLMEKDFELANKVKEQIIAVLCDRLRKTDNLINEGVIWGFKMTV